MPRILVTGANGALAKKVINLLSEDINFEIIASSRNPENIPEKYGNVQYVSNDALIRTDVLKDVDFVLHTAFPRNFEVKDMFEGAVFLEALLQKSIDTNVKNFINISSQSVYGNYREQPSKETDKLNPQDIYALTKYQCERIGLALTKNEDINFTNIRLASLIGKEFPERVINKMINFAIQNNAITVMNDKDTFGFLHINDAAEGLCEFLKNSHPTEWKPVYNLGAYSNNTENLAYISGIIKELCSSRGLNVEVTINKQEKANKICLQNSQLFYNDAKWEPKKTLKETIRLIFEEMK